VIFIKRKIGILCSGGDAPGINNVINKLFFEFLETKIELYGFLDGFWGIYVKKYKLIKIEDIDGKQFSGGSIIGCERFPQLTQPKIFNQILSNLKEIGIPELIIFGGDGSLKGAKLLEQEKIKVHFIPTTIDNDILGVQNTLGFKTALQTIVEMVARINDSALDHQKISIIEVMGRTCPDLSIQSSLACNADFTININNYQDKDLYQKLNTKINNSQKRSPIIIVSEKLIDLQEIVGKIDSQKGKWVNILGHIQRGGAPNADDLILGNKIALKIAQNVLHKTTNFIYKGD
jgi:6-phosphofructokinase 1